MAEIDDLYEKLTAAERVVLRNALSDYLGAVRQSLLSIEAVLRPQLEELPGTAKRSTKPRGKLKSVGGGEA